MKDYSGYEKDLFALREADLNQVWLPVGYKEDGKVRVCVGCNDGVGDNVVVSCKDGAILEAFVDSLTEGIAMANKNVYQFVTSYTNCGDRLAAITDDFRHHSSNVTLHTEDELATFVSRLHNKVCLRLRFLTVTDSKTVFEYNAKVDTIIGKFMTPEEKYCIGDEYTGKNANIWTQANKFDREVHIINGVLDFMKIASEEDQEYYAESLKELITIGHVVGIVFILTTSSISELPERFKGIFDCGILVDSQLHKTNEKCEEDMKNGYKSLCCVSRNMVNEERTEISYVPLM